MHFDNICCSTECFLLAGKLPLLAVRDKELKEQYRKDIGKLRRNKKAAKKAKKKCSQDKEFYKTWEWLALRYQILKKFGPQCMLCRTMSGPIQVDHIKPRSKYPDLALDFNNLQVLCLECNRGKSNHDETDYRPNGVSNAEANKIPPN